MLSFHLHLYMLIIETNPQSELVQAAITKYYKLVN